MHPYVMRFAMANLAFTVATSVIIELLNLKSGQGLAIGATIASCVVAAAQFAKDKARAPTAEENAAFAWRALLVTWLIALLLMAVVSLVFLSAAESQALQQELLRVLHSGTALALGAGVFLAVSALYYAVIRWSFGWFAKVALRRNL